LLAHHRDRLVEIGVHVDRNRIVGAHVGEQQGCDVLSTRDPSDHDVTVRDDADELLVLDDEHVPDAGVAHQLCRVDHRIER
jgi:hypothetical protein